MAKILLIILSEKEEKIRMTPNFVKNQAQKGNEVRVVFWGPSERTLSSSEALQESYRFLYAVKPKACMNTAKANGFVENFSRSFESIPVGDHLTQSIAERVSK